MKGAANFRFKVTKFLISEDNELPKFRPLRRTVPKLANFVECRLHYFCTALYVLAPPKTRAQKRRRLRIRQISAMLLLIVVALLWLLITGIGVITFVKLS